MGVTHAFTNPKGDPADTSIVRPSDWNADHEGMPVAGWYNAYPDYGASRNAATAQAAQDACVAGGGGTVFLDKGTWAFGSTSLTYSGDSVLIKGAGRDATIITYSGSSAAIKNSDTSTLRMYCGIEDMRIVATGSATACIELDNFGSGAWQRLMLSRSTSTGDCLSLKAGGTHRTHYNLFQHIQMWAYNGVCIHITGGTVNRNTFISIKCELDSADAQAIVMTPDTGSHDTNCFIKLSIAGVGKDPVIDLQKPSSYVCYCHTFIDIQQETSTANCSVDIASGNTRNYIIGGYPDLISNSGSANVILTYDQMDLSCAALGFYGTDPISKPTVSGTYPPSTGMDSLVTALSGLGLVTDSVAPIAKPTVGDTFTSLLTALTDLGLVTNSFDAPTGWGAPTGTATRTTFATDTVTLIELARRVHALIDDLTTLGLIKA